jgi:soluble lytic murein transglycosylase
VQAGRSPEAQTQFEAIRDPASLGAAAYQRARILLSRSGSTTAIPALLRVPEVAGADTASAGIALFLAGDLVADQGEFRPARDHYARVAAEYPTAGHAPRALLEVGTLSYLLGENDRALEAFQGVAERYPEREEGSAGLYWAGRIDAMRGDRASALARWRTLIAAVPHSYYALAAARRLGEPAWTPDSTVALEPSPPEMLAALARVSLLDSLGFAPEREYELDFLTRQAAGDPQRLIRTAQALATAGHTSRSVGLAQRALAAGAPRTRSLYLLLFPIPEPAVFTDLVAARGLDPWLTAGLIKQESGFNPRARSAADARGLMQVLPSVGAQLARGLGWSEWESVLLYQPEVSLTLGTLHLRDMRRQYPESVRFLAAYNAGGTRVRRWDGRPKVLDDPELYLEMIPYIETRTYVRRVLRNAAFYEGLYGR